MAGCIRNIRTKNYQNLIIGFQVTFENVWDAFLGHSVFSCLRLFFSGAFPKFLSSWFCGHSVPKTQLEAI